MNISNFTKIIRVAQNWTFIIKNGEFLLFPFLISHNAIFNQQ